MKTKQKLFRKDLIIKAVKDSFAKLNPIDQSKNIVMFIVYIGAIYTTGAIFSDLFKHQSIWFNFQLAVWFWLTVLFANFSEAFAEGQGKAKADTLRKTKKEMSAKKSEADGAVSIVSASTLKTGDLVICSAGDIIPGDGEIIEGIASIDESAITGESAPVVRESGGDRSSVIMGTKVISDTIKIRICSEPGQSFIDKMIKLIENASRQKTPNEIALTILLNCLTAIFIIATVTILFFVNYSIKAGPSSNVFVTIPILIALLVCLIPTTIGGLLSAVGVSGMIRLLKKNVIAASGRAIEAAGDIDVLLLDKTGTITFGNRMADEIIPANGISLNKCISAAFKSSAADETPEGKSIIDFISKKFDKYNIISKSKTELVPFSALTKMSGINEYDENNNIIKYRKGAASAIKEFVKNEGGIFPGDIKKKVNEISLKGGTPLVVAENKMVMGVIYLKDIIKPDIKKRFEELRSMGIKSVMITGDNQLTAATIAAEANVDDFIAESTPESKLKKIRLEQNEGRLVAMVGDGSNDAPALAQADVGLVMNSGTQTAKEAGNMIDLDNDPTKLIEVVETGKQLLMTRGALTTFSIANDIAKYFAILPAIFIGLYSFNASSPAETLNIMHLTSPQSAILSAVIFNALIIIALLPLALKGVTYKAQASEILLKKNLLIYGLGGLIAPFIGIKAIDVIITIIGLV